MESSEPTIGFEAVQLFGRYSKPADELLAAIMLVHGCAGLIAATTTLYWYVGCIAAVNTSCVHPLAAGAAIAIEVLLFTSVALVRGPLQNSAPGRTKWMIYFSASILGVFAGSAFFTGVMHDVALSFGSHGRFGCNLGQNDLILTDTSLHVSLFVIPPFLVVLVLVGRRLSARRRDD